MFPIRDHNPSERTPFVTYALIAINVVVFLTYLPLFADEARLVGFFDRWALIPARFAAGEGYGTLVTSMFLHGGFLHIIGNMLFLWVFGDNLEDAFGHAGFLLFYLACGIAAALAQALPDPSSTIPMVGASGAIAGVMGGYLLLFPRARVDVIVILIILVRMIALPAWVMLGVWFALQALSSYTSLGAATGGVAHLAHVGGFVAGVLLALPFWLRAGAPRFWSRTHGHPPHPRRRSAPASPPSPASPAAAGESRCAVALAGEATAPAHHPPVRVVALPPRDLGLPRNHAGHHRNLAQIIEQRVSGSRPTPGKRRSGARSWPFLRPIPRHSAGPASWRRHGWRHAARHAWPALGESPARSKLTATGGIMPSRLLLLGPVRLVSDGAVVPGLGIKARATLAYLATRPDRRGARNTLATLLWDGPEPRHALRQMLLVLRQRLGGDAARLIAAGPDTVTLADVETDLDLFDRHLAAGQAEAACALWRGRFCHGLDAGGEGFEEWLTLERGRLDDRAAAAFARLAADAAAAGRIEAAIAAARQRVAIHPLMTPRRPN